MIAHGMERGFNPWEKTFLALGWIAPVCARQLAKLTYIPLGFLTLSAIFVLIVLRARAEQAVEAGQISSARRSGLAAR